MTDTTDYVTINPAVAYRRFNAVIMRYDRHQDTYVVFRISEPLTLATAQSLAHSWAAASHLEVRGVLIHAIRPQTGAKAPRDAE